jgi:hypothetical protein
MTALGYISVVWYVKHFVSAKVSAPTIKVSLSNDLASPSRFITVRAPMGQQYNKVIKRKRRDAYLKRKKQALKQRVPGKSAAPAAKA